MGKLDYLLRRIRSLAENKDDGCFAIRTLKKSIHCGNWALRVNLAKLRVDVTLKGKHEFLWLKNLQNK